MCSIMVHHESTYYLACLVVGVILVHRGFLKYGNPPKSSISRWDLPWFSLTKTIWGYPDDFGNPHTMETLPRRSSSRLRGLHETCSGHATAWALSSSATRVMTEPWNLRHMMNPHLCMNKTYPWRIHVRMPYEYGNIYHQQKPQFC